MRSAPIQLKDAAWLPIGITPGDPALGTAVRKAIEWIEDRRIAEHINPMLASRRRDVSVSRDLVRFATRYEQITLSSGTRSAHKRPILAFAPDPELLELATRWGAGHAVCVVGGDEATSRGWAWATGATDLRTGSPAQPPSSLAADALRRLAEALASDPSVGAASPAATDAVRILAAEGVSDTDYIAYLTACGLTSAERRELRALTG